MRMARASCLMVSSCQAVFGTAISLAASFSIAGVTSGASHPVDRSCSAAGLKLTAMPSCMESRSGCTFCVSSVPSFNPSK